MDRPDIGPADPMEPIVALVGPALAAEVQEYAWGHSLDPREALAELVAKGVELTVQEAEREDWRRGDVDPGICLVP